MFIAHNTHAPAWRRDDFESKTVEKTNRVLQRSLSGRPRKRQLATNLINENPVRRRNKTPLDMQNA